MFLDARFVLFLALAVILGASQPLQAQISEGGEPYGLSNPIRSKLSPVVLSPVDVDAFLAADEEKRRQGRTIPFRYGAPIEVDLGLDNAGTWTDLPNGDRLWSLKIKSPGATALGLIYDTFQMPLGARFFVYNEDASMVLGAFTIRNNKKHGKFATAPVRGDAVILEYYEPLFLRGEGTLHVTRVIHAFRDASGPGVRPTEETGAGKSMDFGESSTCNVNVNCSQGSGWGNERDAVALVLTDVGTACTGALVNNVPQNLTAYFLTANHCLSGNVNNWLFRFNYQNNSCSNVDGPYNNVVQGAMVRASDTPSDFALLELDVLPPKSYDVYYAGWSRSTSAATSSVSIHHPRADIKKISIDNDTAVSDTWGGTPPNSHWEVYFDTGTAEYGSSGAPLFDQNHRIVGQLHGNIDPAFTGDNFCAVPHIWFGKFSISWNYGSSSSTRLKNWLDPSSQSPTMFNGRRDPRPHAPTNLTITNFYSVGQYPNLSWTASATSGVSSYKVYRGICSGSCTWQYIGSTSATSYTDYQITITAQANAEEQYTYYVSAIKGSYESDQSNWAWVWGEYIYIFPKHAATDEASTEAAGVPEALFLYPNYPNPFNPATEIRFALPGATQVSLVVSDFLGREVARLVDGPMEAGYHRVTFDASHLPSGTYLYRLQVDNFSQIHRMVLVK